MLSRLGRSVFIPFWGLYSSCRCTARLGWPFKSPQVDVIHPAELFAERIARHCFDAFLEALNICIHLTNVLFGLVHVHGFDVILGLAGVRLESSRGLFSWTSVRRS